MLDALQFVKGAIAKKDIIPGLQHFRIADGLIKSYNGTIALCSPIPIALNCQPKAIPMIKSIETCKETVHLSITPAGRLTVKSGKFRAHIDCDPSESFPDVQPCGDIKELPGTLLVALRKLEPLIGEDMSRIWSRGILFRGDFAFATNNVLLCQYWLGYTFPFELVIPHSAVNELLRIGEDPTHIQMEPNSVTFHYPGNRWMRTQTYSTEWPDLGRILDKPASYDYEVADADFFNAVRTLLPHAIAAESDNLFLLGNKASTHFDEGMGASVELEGLPTQACLNIKQVLLLEPLALQLDLSLFPAGPLLFAGENLRGALARLHFPFPEVL